MCQTFKERLGWGRVPLPFLPCLVSWYQEMVVLSQALVLVLPTFPFAVASSVVFYVVIYSSPQTANPISPCLSIKAIQANIDQSCLCTSNWGLEKALPEPQLFFLCGFQEQLSINFCSISQIYVWNIVECECVCVIFVTTAQLCWCAKTTTRHTGGTQLNINLKKLCWPES